MKFLILKRKSLLLTQVFTRKSFRSHFNFQVKMYKSLMLYSGNFAGCQGIMRSFCLGVECQLRSPEYVFILSLKVRNPSGHPPCPTFILASSVLEEPFRVDYQINSVWMQHSSTMRHTKIMLGFIPQIEGTLELAQFLLKKK